MLRPWVFKIDLRRGSPAAVYLQIAHALAEEIRRGRVAPGAVLPGTRQLAAMLGVNRETAVLAYDELTAQGWLLSESLPPPAHGCLDAWAGHGVLLLNSVLSVEEGRAASHAGQGGEELTDAVVRAVADRRPHVAFVLWGAYAQRKAGFVDRTRHLVLASPHPSPLSAHRGFFGSRPFSRVNAYLRAQGLEEIDWRLP